MHKAPTYAYLRQLLLLNVVLQVFDGVATYQGLQLGWREANPILVFTFEALGIGPALLLFKLNACGLLWLLHWLAPLAVAVAVLRMLAAVYCVLSLAPWLGKYLSLALSLA